MFRHGLRPLWPALILIAAYGPIGVYFVVKSIRKARKLRANRHRVVGLPDFLMKRLPWTYWRNLRNKETLQ